MQKSFASEHYDQFRHDLDFYLTGVMVNKVKRDRLDSILVFDAVRETIRTHVHHIKVHIDKPTMSDAKRATLHRNSPSSRLI